MRREEMAGEAQKCREQARHFDAPERELLLKIAKAFDEMALVTETHHGVAEARCW